MHLCSECCIWVLVLKCCTSFKDVNGFSLNLPINLRCSCLFSFSVCRTVNMSGLQCMMQDSVWFDKPRYDEAERRFYEGMNGITHSTQPVRLLPCTLLCSTLLCTARLSTLVFAPKEDESRACSIASFLLNTPHAKEMYECVGLFVRKTLWWRLGRAD